ncbi:rod shape-determining protein MreC [Secundilactobacillus oryzae JCM 18671]|uniref:Cell shape-determining protein MreC n=1 Tax=Secundilactobacillus oryzae JCM 18671 TaxID=1291743 RepID=A0A081BIQ5_9LACO|nr:rod shape-determining protein MreC [Secundilactobacillus oryzae]GAK47923.1 rod shape-determining protein MreC [Secundilactobacillus oryzae JCM 18671]
MRRFFSNRRLVIIIVCVIICIALMNLSVVIRNKRSTPPLIQQFGNDIVGFADRVVALPVNGLQGTAEAISGLLNTYQENEKLKSQVEKLTQTQVRDETLSRENKQLKKELSLNSSLTDYSAVTAAVISRTPSSWQSQVIINKGQASGIKKNMPVLSGAGLVGRISEVNKTNSKVELISDNNDSANRFAIQITNGSGQTVNGVISEYDKEANRIVMGNVTSKTKLKKGDKVITSGLGGVTPKGLYVGTVETAGDDDYGLASKVVIKPAGDLSNLNIVTVAVAKE